MMKDEIKPEVVIELGSFEVDGKDYKWDHAWEAYLTHYLHDDAIGAKQMKNGKWAGYFCGSFDDFTEETFDSPQEAAVHANYFFT